MLNVHILILWSFSKQRRHSLSPSNPSPTTIDQISFRTKGNVVVFGLMKLLTKDCKYYFFCSHWLLRGGDAGGGVGVWVRGGIS
jgi:hypothetical protein